MNILRIATGAMAAGYGLFSLAPIAADAAYKLDLFTPRGEATRIVPLWDATPWWQLGASAGVAGIFLLIGWRLVRGRSALGFYVVALFANAALWWAVQSSTAYQQVFTQAELQLDYALLLATAVFGVLIWWLERKPAAEALQA